MNQTPNQTATMPYPDTANPAYSQARQHAARVRGFYVHCLAYALGNLTNIVVNWITRQHGGNWWFQWPLIAWTVALAVHAITITARGSWLGPRWEERQIRKYLKRDSTAPPP
jgi:hypothetical protein